MEYLPHTGPFITSAGNALGFALMALSSLAQPILATLLAAALAIALTLTLRLPFKALLGLLLTLPVIVLSLFWAAGHAVPMEMPTRSPQTALRIAHLNSLFYVPQTEAKLAFTQTSQADVISLVEVNRKLATQLQEDPTYPYKAISLPQTRPDNLPMALLSRWPISLVLDLSPRRRLYLIQHPTTPFYVLQLHAKSPWPPSELPRRNEDLASVLLALKHTPLIVIGDFNTTPWDPALKPFRNQLTNTTGLAPTFPSGLPVTPIDHLYATQNFPTPTVHRLRVPRTDHLGLIADFPTLPLK